MSRHADPVIGSELAGYRLESVLGKGGMGIVYLAEHLRLHRRAALKLLPAELAEDPRFRERFLRELEIAARLDHPNVIPIYDAGEADGVLYIAMRYVEGTDLRALLKREHALRPSRALDILWQVAGALDAAHGRGLVHRDVKPGNVLLAEGEHAYLCDFGLSKQVSSSSGLTGSGEFLGTVDYTAPEQIRGEALDFRADLYSLGCVLYECLAGETPFRRDSDLAVLWAHLQEQPPALQGKRADLPQEVDRVVARALAKEPQERFGSGRDLVATARDVLAVHGLAPELSLQPLGAQTTPSAPTVPTESGSPAGERKLATVLFADLVGSPELGEQDPERTRALLDRFYDAMDAEIESAGGTVEFIGAAVMAVFGVPTAQEDHAERALHAALSMQRRIEESVGDELSLRIGVNTGDVIVARPRAGSSFVSGDAVNVAARLEQSASPGEILVGERTVGSARSAFEFDGPRTIEAKGRPDGIPCRRLTRALGSMRPRGVGGLRRTFVGRQSELELLQATYRRVVREREPHCVTIMGDAGVGKTSLVGELWAMLAAELPEPLRLTGRCIPYGRGITYWPLGEILKQHFGIQEDTPPETVRRLLGAREGLGLTLGLEPVGALHPLAVRHSLYEAWVEFLGELVANRPAVVLVEDLHWAEEPLLDLIDRLVRDVRGPLLVLATGRPELLDRRPAWGGGKRNAATLWLGPLSSADATRMLEELVAGQLPGPLSAIVVERAEGNPFFIEELVGSLIDQGALGPAGEALDEQQFQPGPAIPDSVQAVLAARIDLLGSAEKAALQTAAVIGRVFWAGPVCELLEGAMPDFEVLEDRDFIRRRSSSTLAGEHEFAFKHALTREVSYSSLPKARRGRLHAAVADWMERAVENHDELAPFLAHHYVEAVRPEDADLAWAGEEEKLAELREKAVAWLRRAAELAVGRYEIDEGLGLLHRAVELGSREWKQTDAWREIGRANALKYDGEAFWAAMQNAISASVDRQTQAELYGELVFQTAIRSGMWRLRPGRELVESWISRGLDLATPDSRARAKALIARSHWQPVAAEEAAREARSIAELLGDAELRSYALDSLAVTAFAGNRFEECLGWSERRLELLDEISDPGHHASILAGAALGYLGCGRIHDARRLARTHEELTRQLTPHHQLHGVAYLLEVEELAGNWQGIRRLGPNVEEAVAANLTTPCVLNSRSLLVSALASAHVADEDEARRLEGSSEALGMEGYSVLLDPPRIQLALLRGELDSAARLLRDAVFSQEETWGQLAALATWLDAFAVLGDRDRIESDALPLMQPGTYLEPFALRALGLVREDRALVEQAAARFDALGLGWHRDRSRALLA